MPAAGFAGCEVVAFENRRGAEMAGLITRFGGRPRVAPAMREARLEENSAAFGFGELLLAGRIDLVILLTGVGAQGLLEVLRARYSHQQLLDALAAVPIVVRGPKPLKVVNGWGLVPAVVTPEPNTWRQMMTALGNSPPGANLRGKTVAVQEYGVAPEPLIKALESAGAQVVRVPVYRWALPDDLEPLRAAMASILAGEGRIILFTNRAQVDHLMRIVAESGRMEAFRTALSAAVIASIGPSCTEELLRHGIRPDIQPEPARMGALVYEAAQQAATLLEAKVKGSGGAGPGANCSE